MPTTQRTSDQWVTRYFWWRRQSFRFGNIALSLLLFAALCYFTPLFGFFGFFLLISIPVAPILFTYSTYAICVATYIRKKHLRVDLVAVDLGKLGSLPGTAENPSAASLLQSAKRKFIYFSIPFVLAIASLIARLGLGENPTEGAATLAWLLLMVLGMSLFLVPFSAGFIIQNSLRIHQLKKRIKTNTLTASN